jgi:hypothetical protein
VTVVNATEATDVARRLGDGNSARPAVVTNRLKLEGSVTAFASDPIGSATVGLA